MIITFYRDNEVNRESRSLPADLYNKIKILFARLEHENVFVPIRTMQYLAVIDAHEVVFVDGQGPRAIELAWKNFRPYERQDLRAPVPYDCVYYQEKGLQTMWRLQGEFMKALQLFEKRNLSSTSSAKIVPLHRG